MGKLLFSIILGGIIFFEGNPVLAVTKTVTQADSTTFTITVESFGGYSGTVTLSASGCPSNATCTFSPNPVSVPAGGSVNSTMTVTTSVAGLTPTGTYAIGVNGTDSENNVTRITDVTLIVNGLIPCTVDPLSRNVTFGGTGIFSETHAGYSYNWSYQGREPNEGAGAVHTIPTCGNYSGATTNSLVTWAAGTSPVGSTCDVRVKVTSGNAWNTCRAQANVVAPTPLPDLIPWNFSACYQLNQTNPNYVDVFVNASEKNIGQAAVSGANAGIVYVTSTDPQCSNYVRTYPPGPSSLPVGSSAVLLSSWRANGYTFAGDGWTLSCAQSGTLYSNLSVNTYGTGIEESDYSNNAQQLDSLQACGPLITPTPTPTPTPLVCTAPVAPSNGFTDNATPSSLRLNWTDNSTDESVFEIFRGGIYLTEVGANIIQQNDPGLSSCTTYIYKVRARKDAVGSCSTLYSAFTAEFSGTTTGCGGTPTPTPTVVVTSTPTPTPIVTATPTSTPAPTPVCEYGPGLGIFATPNPVTDPNISTVTVYPDPLRIQNCTNPIPIIAWNETPSCGDYAVPPGSGQTAQFDSTGQGGLTCNVTANVTCVEGIAECIAPIVVNEAVITPPPTATPGPVSVCDNGTCIWAASANGRPSCNMANGNYDCQPHGPVTGQCTGISVSPSKVEPGGTVTVSATALYQGVSYTYGWGSWTGAEDNVTSQYTQDSQVTGWRNLDATYGTTNWVWADFRPSIPGKMDSVDVYVQNALGGVYAAVFDGDTLIAENRGFAANNNKTWLNIKFARSANVLTTKTYRLKLRDDPQYSGTASWALRETGGSSYFYFKTKIMPTGTQVGTFSPILPCSNQASCGPVTWTAPASAMGTSYTLAVDVHNSGLPNKGENGETTNSNTAGNPSACFATVEIGYPGWFQTKGGDIHSEWGLSSAIPAAYEGNKYVSLVLESYPGIISYGSQTANFGSGGASGKGWLVGGGYTFGTSDNICGSNNCFQYFSSMVSATPLSTGDFTLTQSNMPSANGSYTVGGNLTMGQNANDELDFGGKTLQFLVDGKVTIKGKVYNRPFTGGETDVGPVSIAAGNDDEDTYGTAGQNDLLYLGKIGSLQSVGLRFTLDSSGNQVPVKNAVISNAKLNLFVKGGITSPAPTTVKMSGEASVNCSSYPNLGWPTARNYLTSYNVSGVSFTQSQWEEVDVTNAIQDIVNQTNWNASQDRSICLKIEAPGATGVVGLESYEQPGSNKAKLSFTWQAETGSEGEGGVMVVAEDGIEINGNLWQGSNTLNNPVVEGAYITDGEINTNYNIATNGRRFSGRGIFVGNGGIALTRDLTDADNLLYPDEYFIYDPSLLIKFRDFVGRPQRFWLEVAP